ncbi:MAG: hypothetical protein A2284_12625, partial [Deltaproteobacteria bacterium RIFOXYA12_FULL_61_11]
MKRRPTVQRQEDGSIDGRMVERYLLEDGDGLAVTIASWGGTVLSLKVPDRRGQITDVVLGLADLVDYPRRSPYFGSIVGRYANRIARGRFELAGRTYQLRCQQDGQHLHGGWYGFDKAFFLAEPVQRGEAVGVLLRHHSPDGDEGYPGNLDLTVVYLLDRNRTLTLAYEATVDRPCPVNLTHHSYFNLAGRGDILGHELLLAAERFVPVDANLIPTGDLTPVAGTPFDFRAPHPIGQRLGEAHEQLLRAGGYDHTFVLDHPAGSMGLAARVLEPESGRVLEVRTSEPGLQCYSGNFLDGSIVGRDGKTYG